MENTCFTAGFNRHIRHRKTAVHLQVINCLAGEFHRGVERTIDTDLPDGIKNQILTANPFPQFAFVDKFDGGRYFHPDITGGHCGGYIGGTHTGGESTDGAVGTGMRVCANDHITR